MIEKLRSAYPEVKQESTLSETLAAINDVTGNKFIIIIDEWDALLKNESRNRVSVMKSEFLDFYKPGSVIYRLIDLTV